jgi:ArsR family transcriptional regulator, lead/cadmium/zinc/bismuth-responsive transcriptional repressor
MTRTRQASQPIADRCSELCRHDDQIETGVHSIATAGDIPAIAEFYKLLGSTTRLKILFALQHTELCVCDIADVIGLSMPATSQQLKAMRQAGIITQRIDGREAYYSLTAPELTDAIVELATRK